MNTIRNRIAAFGVTGALAIAAPAWAGPLPTGTATVKAAASDQITDVQWRGRGHHRGIGPGIAFGLAAGALAGAAIASQPYGPGYGYYEEPVYAAPYGYEPMYEAPVSAYGYPPPTYSYGLGYSRGARCTTDEGYGRRTAC